MTKKMTQLAGNKGVSGKREWEQKRMELLKTIKSLESVSNRDWLVEGVLALGA